MIQSDADILWNRKLGPMYFHLGLSLRGFEQAVPGQFITLRAQRQQSPLLRRPFSIHRLIQADNRVQGIEILYRTAGDCTRYLSTLAPGEKVNILGPLGNGFSLPDSGRIFLVAGGIGVAPMVFLAETLRQKSHPSEITIFLGGRTQTDLLCQKAFLDLGLRLELSTDDGSTGHQGLVTDLLKKHLTETKAHGIYACGPMPMLAAVAGLARSHAVPCQVSIETIMACGMGVCLGCALDDQVITDKYRHVCIDGPVFDAATLKFDN